MSDLTNWLSRDRDPGACPICGAAHSACRGPNDRDVRTARVPWRGGTRLVVVPPGTPPAPAPAPDDETPAA